MNRAGEGQGGRGAEEHDLSPASVWEVFARRKYDEPLHHIGNVLSPDEALAQVYARALYDEFTWIEMVVVPRGAIVPVTAPP